ncbi:MAG: hypothetical protein V4812_18570 [Pseudomonadota bacterium]
MTTAEKFELALIPVVGVVIWLIAERLPARIGIGSLLLASSVLLLFQGLIRDLWLISTRSRQSAVGTRQEALCMCVESTIGVTGVVAGLIILGCALDSTLPVGSWLWSVVAVGVLTIGFAVKDFIFVWRPFRIRRVKDHINIVFSWKS